MRRVATAPARELEDAIDGLPPTTRAAMLAAVRCPETRLISGGYVSAGGGVCPLLAAHRRGGRTHDDSAGVSAFAGVWDRYTGTRTGEPRVVEERERRALEAMLVASVERERRVRATAEQDARRRDDRTAELRIPAGRVWLGAFRRYDDYQAALAAAGEAGVRPPNDGSERVPAGV